jgi:hypothetical protein
MGEWHLWREPVAEVKGRVEGPRQFSVLYERLYPGGRPQLLLANLMLMQGSREETARLPGPAVLIKISSLSKMKFLS